MKTELSGLTNSGVCLEELIDKAFRHMKELGYSPSASVNCRCVWRRLLRLDGAEVFSQDLIRRYLASQGMPADALDDYSKVDPGRRRILSALQTLNQYASHGGLPSRHHSRKVELSKDFEKALNGYVDYCFKEQGHSASTVYRRKYELTKFLVFLPEHMGPNLGDLRATHLSAFLEQRSHWKPSAVAGVVRCLKSFLHYLWISEVLPEDLSPALPKARIWRDAHIPTVWNPQEVTAILSAVDRSSPRGKRDYAILLLACRLGLRSCDIRKLRLDDLHWAESRIVIVQSKTKEPLVLPLLEDVAEALIDYLRHGRPKSNYREVFLRLNAPFTPFDTGTALWVILDFYRRRARVSAPLGHRGIHSLRHTVATRLLEKGTPLEVISEVLGHVSVESTRIYTKVDINALRSAALNPDCLQREEVPHAL